MQVSWSPIASWISTRSHGRIDAARQAADHPSAADLSADALDLGGAKAGHRPAPGQAGDAVGEIAQELRAVRRVGDLEMELHGVEFARIVGDGGERRALADAHRAKARR